MRRMGLRARRGLWGVGRLLALSRCLVLASVLVLWLCPEGYAAQASGRRIISPLPASDYSTRSVCAVPGGGGAGCLAVELVPRTAAARAHSHPLGLSRVVPTGVVKATAACEPPKAAEACYGLRPQDFHSAYSLPTAAASQQTIAIVDAYDDPTAEEDLGVYDEQFRAPPLTAANGCFTKVNEMGESAHCQP